MLVVKKRMSTTNNLVKGTMFTKGLGHHNLKKK
jgi:hypothetical protein